MNNPIPPRGSLRKPDTAPAALHVTTAPPWVRLRAWFFCGSLDEKLAQGEHPVTNNVLEARSKFLTSPRFRRTLSDSWLNLLIEARRPYSPFGPIIPLVSDRILASESDIRVLADELVGPLPTVRGVAMAITTLRDGAGPLFNRACNQSLPRCIDQILLQLNPLTSSAPL